MFEKTKHGTIQFRFRTLKPEFSGLRCLALYVGVGYTDTT